MTTIFDNPPMGILDSVQFGLYSDEELVKMAVMEVTLPQCSSNRGALYDLRMGSTDRANACLTCMQTYDTCQGHFGYFHLNTEVIMLPAHVLTFLNCLCLKCGRLLATKEALQPMAKKTFATVWAYAFGLSTCLHCKEPHPTVRYTDNKFKAIYKHKQDGFTMMLDPLFIQAVFKRPSPNEIEQDMRLLCLEPSLMQPQFLVHTIFPVMPNHCRMRIHTDVETDADVTLNYKQMLEKARALLTETDAEKRKALVDFLNMRAITFVDHNKLKPANRKDFFKMYESVASFLNSSESREAKGYLRLKIQGRRTNFNCRTVITPDPSLKMRQMRVPRFIAGAVTKPEYVTHHNIWLLQHILDVQCKMKPASVTEPLPFRIQLVEQDGKQFVTRSLDHTLLVGDQVWDTEKDCVKEGAWFPLRKQDVILRYGKPLPLKFFHKILRIGDKVHRTLKGTITRHDGSVDRGDLVILNRQPTLHRASMQAMEVVLQPANIKTFSFSLVLCSGFNGDFDGDEMNVFVPQCLEAEAELQELMRADTMFCSLQSSKAEYPMIQDTILGAYEMSFRTISRACAMQLYMTMVDKVDGTILRPFDQVFPQPHMKATALVGALLPTDFQYDFEGVQIVDGRVASTSVFTSLHLGKNKASIHLLLFLEYCAETAIAFTDGMQALCVEFLGQFPVTIGISDCFSLATDDEERIALLEMNRVLATTFSSSQYSSYSAAKIATDTAMDNAMMSYKNRCARKLESLKRGPDGPLYATNFDRFIESGSKGDRFNLHQIFIGLGKQHKMFGSPRVNGGKRRLFYYPHVIKNRRDKFQSMGFVFSSFFAAATKAKPYTGLTPIEMIFHAESGREGVVCKAVKTAQTGYNHRRISKHMENINVAYDQTIRNHLGRIFQWQYGGDVGFAMDRVTFTNGMFEPVNVGRLAAKLNSQDRTRPTAPIADIDRLVEQAIPLPECVDGPLREMLVARNRAHLRKMLATVRVANEAAFKQRLVDRYLRARVEPGDPIGFNTANSVGESKTQTNLNLFHKSGSNQMTEDDAHQSFEQIIEMTKSNVDACYTIHFARAYYNLTELRDDVGMDEGRPIAQVLLRDIITRWSKTGADEICLWLNRKACFNRRLSPATLVRALREPEARLVLTPDEDCIVYRGAILPNLDVVIGGLPGLVRWEVMRNKETGALFAMASGNIAFTKLFAHILGHPLVDCKRTKCNHAAIVYKTLGLIECRRVLKTELRHALPNIHETHIQMIVDVMTQQGMPKNFTRYTMRTMGEGPWSHASFEEPMKAIFDGIRNTTKDPLTSVSASVMWGRKVGVGTGMVTLVDKPPSPPPQMDDDNPIPEFLHLSYL